MISLRHVVSRTDSFELRIDALDLPIGINLLVGRNGAGKSTLLRILSTASVPDEGELQYAGHRLQTDLPLIRRNLGYLPTGLELYEEMTPRKLLRYLCSLKGIGSQNEAELWLEQLRIAHLADQDIRQLSQGQKQLLGIAQACLGQPVFMMLDEPLNYLDSLEKKQVVHVLAAAARRSVVIVATHELNEWQHVADRVIWLDGGSMRFAGTLLQWGSRLPYDVWKGLIPAEELERLRPERLLHCRPIERQGTVEIRWIGEPPLEGMGDWVETTPEDAYFIRRYMMDGQELRADNSGMEKSSP